MHVPGAGTVEITVSQHDAFRQIECCLLERDNAVDGALARAGCRQVERIALGACTLARRIHESDALRDHAPDPRRFRGIRQIARARHAQGGVALKSFIVARRPGRKGKIGKLVHQHLRCGPFDRARASASASNTSTTTGSAPRSASAAALSFDRVVPTTVCPAPRSNGVNRRPMAPPAPARNIFMLVLETLKSFSAPYGGLSPRPSTGPALRRSWSCARPPPRAFPFPLRRPLPARAP